MIALLLNSGLGTRMGDETREHPKCMCDIGGGESIISWQLKLLERIGIREAVVTTGHLSDMLEEYLLGLHSPIHFTFVHNPKYRETNYIYSMYLAREYLQDDVISLHGDLVMHPEVMDRLAASTDSCGAVDATIPLPEKDFKAEMAGNRIRAVGVDRFGEGCVAFQPAYKLLRKDMARWMEEIGRFVAEDNVRCYAENAFNAAWEEIPVYGLDVRGLLCSEIDNQEDRDIVRARFLREVKGE